MPDSNEVFEGHALRLLLTVQHVDAAMTQLTYWRRFARAGEQELAQNAEQQLKEAVLAAQYELYQITGIATGTAPGVQSAT